MVCQERRDRAIALTPFERRQHLFVPKLGVGIWTENHGTDSTGGAPTIGGVQPSAQSDFAVRMLIASEDRVTLRRLDKAAM